jgi:phosphohistidine phosphatase
MFNEKRGVEVKRMKVYLVQHAEAKSKQEDPDRPLSDLGRANIEKVASYLADHAEIELDCIYHSGKTRALQTAEVLGNHLHPRNGLDGAEGLQPLDDPKIWADKLSETNSNVMLVGHLPHMSKLAATLVCNDPDRKVIDFINAGVVCIGTDDDGRKDWSVRWIMTPQIAG